MKAVPGGLKVFAGASHPSLASDICQHLGIPLGRAHTTRFSNENLKIKIDENVREQDVFVVQTACPPLSEHIVELLIMLDALRHASVKRVTAVIPYFPYARSHKKDEPRISITARLMADLGATAGAAPVPPVARPPPPRPGLLCVPPAPPAARRGLTAPPAPAHQATPSALTNGARPTGAPGRPLPGTSSTRASPAPTSFGTSPTKAHTCMP